MVDKVTQSQLNKNRLDKFLLVINLPPVMRNINNQSLRVRSNDKVNENSVQFSVFGSVIPEISVPEVAAGYSGQTYKLSSHSRPPYNNITVYKYKPTILYVSGAITLHSCYLHIGLFGYSLLLDKS